MASPRRKTVRTGVRPGNTYKSQLTMRILPSREKVPSTSTAITSDHGDFVDETRPKPFSIELGGS